MYVKPHNLQFSRTLLQRKGIDPRENPDKAFEYLKRQRKISTRRGNNRIRAEIAALAPRRTDIECNPYHSIISRNLNHRDFLLELNKPLNEPENYSSTFNIYRNNHRGLRTLCYEVGIFEGIIMDDCPFPLPGNGPRTFSKANSIDNLLGELKEATQRKEDYDVLFVASPHYDELRERVAMVSPKTAVIALCSNRFAPPVAANEMRKQGKNAISFNEYMDPLKLNILLDRLIGEQLLKKNN